MERARAVDAKAIEDTLAIAVMFAGYLKDDCYPKIIEGELVPQQLTEETRDLFLRGIKTRLIDALRDVMFMENFQRRHDKPLSIVHTEGQIGALVRYFQKSLPEGMSQKMREFIAA